MAAIATFLLQEASYAVKAASTGALFAEDATGRCLPLEPVVSRMGFRRLPGAYRLLTPSGDHLRLLGEPVWVNIFGDLAEVLVGASPTLPQREVGA